MLPSRVTIDFDMLKDLHLMLADDFGQPRIGIEDVEVIVSGIRSYDDTGTHVNNI